MRKGRVKYNSFIAGEILESSERKYIFKYDESYLENTLLPPISVHFPKSEKQFNSNILFPFFFNMLSEGVNRKLQCRMLKIDETDDFGLLLKTAAHETIGAITVEEIND